MSTAATSGCRGQRSLKVGNRVAKRPSAWLWLPDLQMGERHDSSPWAEPLQYSLPQTHTGLGPATGGGRDKPTSEAAHLTSSSLPQFPGLSFNISRLAIVTRAWNLSKVGRTSYLFKIICKPLHKVSRLCGLVEVYLSPVWVDCV